MSTFAPVGRWNWAASDRISALSAWTTPGRPDTPDKAGRTDGLSGDKIKLTFVIYGSY